MFFDSEVKKKILKFGAFEGFVGVGDFSRGLVRGVGSLIDSGGLDRLDL